MIYKNNILLKKKDITIKIDCINIFIYFIIYFYIAQNNLSYFPSPIIKVERVVLTFRLVLQESSRQ